MVKQTLIAAVLVIVTVGLGIFFFLRANSISFKSFFPESTESPSPQAYTTIDQLLLPFEGSPSASQLKEYSAAVARLAKKGTLITLNDCNPNPQILETNSDEISFNNKSLKEVKIIGFPTLKASIPAGQTVVVKIEPAIYPYSCDFVATSSAITSVRGLISFPQTIPATGMELTKQQAVETTQLNLASCKADHAVIKVKQGDDLTFKNTGKEKERIYLSDTWDFNLEVAAQNTQQVKINPGIYTLNCQSKTSDFIPTSLIYIP